MTPSFRDLLWTSSLRTSVLGLPLSEICFRWIFFELAQAYSLNGEGDVERSPWIGLKPHTLYHLQRQQPSLSSSWCVFTQICSKTGTRPFFPSWRFPKGPGPGWPGVEAVEGEFVSHEHAHARSRLSVSRLKTLWSVLCRNVWIVGWGEFSPWISRCLQKQIKKKGSSVDWNSRPYSNKSEALQDGIE